MPKMKDCPEKRCATCAFFDQKNETEGWCVIMPPRIILTKKDGRGNLVSVSGWPSVQKQQFCGNFISETVF